MNTDMGSLQMCDKCLCLKSSVMTRNDSIKTSLPLTLSEQTMPVEPEDAGAEKNADAPDQLHPSTEVMSEVKVYLKLH